MNEYDLEHVTTGHPLMSADEWQKVYGRAWDLYYSAGHIETMFRRAKASGIKPVHLLDHILQFSSPFIQRNLHPLQGELFPPQNPPYPPLAPAARKPARLLSPPFARGDRDHAQLAAFYLYLHRIRRRVKRDDRPYTIRADADARSRTTSPPRAKDPDRRRRLTPGAGPSTWR